MSLDITFRAIECGVTTCSGYGESCHRWPSLIKKWSLTTIVLRLKEIRYCTIVARDSLKILAYDSLPKYWMQKLQKSSNKMCQLAPVYSSIARVLKCNAKKLSKKSYLQLDDVGMSEQCYRSFNITSNN